MATNLELKTMLNVLRAEVTALRDRVGALEALPDKLPALMQQVLDNAFLASKPMEVAKLSNGKIERKMCPHCGVKPAYYFHTKNCKADKNKNNGRKEETT